MDEDVRFRRTLEQRVAVQNMTGERTFGSVGGRVRTKQRASIMSHDIDKTERGEKTVLLFLVTD